MILDSDSVNKSVLRLLSLFSQNIIHIHNNVMWGISETIMWDIVSPTEHCYECE